MSAAEALLNKLNEWLIDNGQFKTYGVDIEAFIEEVEEELISQSTPTPGADAP